MIHPYYPPSLHLPDYIPNTHSLSTLLLTFLSLSTLLITATLTSIHIYRPHLSLYDRSTTVWFILCGTIHCTFESYFLVHHKSLSGLQSLPAQLWKEYALSDSRYLTSDPLLLSLESVTVLVLGPLCFLAAGLIVKDSVWRAPMQSLICVGHLYSDVLYFVACGFASQEYSRPEAWYYWGYFVGLNSLWIVVPGVLLWKEARRWTDALKVSKEKRVKKYV